MLGPVKGRTGLSEPASCWPVGRRLAFLTLGMHGVGVSSGDERRALAVEADWVTNADTGQGFGCSHMGATSTLLAEWWAGLVRP